MEGMNIFCLICENRKKVSNFVMKPFMTAGEGIETLRFCLQNLASVKKNLGLGSIK